MPQFVATLPSPDRVGRGGCAKLARRQCGPVYRPSRSQTARLMELSSESRATKNGMQLVAAVVQSQQTNAGQQPTATDTRRRITAAAADSSGDEGPTSRSNALPHLHPIIFF